MQKARRLGRACCSRALGARGLLHVVAPQLAAARAAYVANHGWKFHKVSNDLRHHGCAPATILRQPHTGRGLGLRLGVGAGWVALHLLGLCRARGCATPLLANAEARPVTLFTLGNAFV